MRGVELRILDTQMRYVFRPSQIRVRSHRVRSITSHTNSRWQNAGFSTDCACAVQVILLADYFGFDSIGTGMPLENSYL